MANGRSMARCDHHSVAPRATQTSSRRKVFRLVSSFRRMAVLDRRHNGEAEVIAVPLQVDDKVPSPSRKPCGRAAQAERPGESACLILQMGCPWGADWGMLRHVDRSDGSNPGVRRRSILSVFEMLRNLPCGTGRNAAAPCAITSTTRWTMCAPTSAAPG
ncbi:hypothetical protein D3C78_1427370 [compost metagenome]